jgi:hypothetical protein
MPKVGFVDVNGFDIQATDIPHMSLDKFHVDLGDYVGFVPTKVGADLNGLDLPVDGLDRESRATLGRLGYDRISLDGRLAYGWDKAKNRLGIDNFRIRAAGIGGIAGSGVIGGVTEVLIENPGSPDESLNLSLLSGKLTFSDESIVGKGLDLIAEKLKAPPDKFRKQFADALPFLLSMSALKNPALLTMIRQSGLLQKLTPALKTFIGEPGGTLTLTMAPPAPVELKAISDAAEKAPETLVGLLNLSFTAEAGKPAPTPAENAPDKGSAPTKELRPTIAPQ